MKTYEFLKEIYEDAKSSYEYMNSFEKFRNFLWVNLAIFSAGLIFIKDISYTPVEFYLFMSINIISSIFILIIIQSILLIFMFIKYKGGG